MNILTNLWNMIDGHKTQVGAALLLVLGFCTSRGYIQQDASDLALGILALWTTAAVVHAEVKKSAVK